MPNTNLLKNMRCPNCGFEGPFYITCNVMFTVNDDGCENHGELEWEDDNACICGQCGHYKTVADFTIKENPDEALWSL